MGIHCEINLTKPLDGAFIPGETISGVVKYAVDKETVFSRITVSLKGNGYLVLKDKHREKRNKISRFRNSEDYVDIDHDITEDKGSTLGIGSYESGFSFKLPQTLPPSIKYLRKTARYVVRCNIQYYIRIKFERPGFMVFPKRFKKEIHVSSGVIPKLPIESIIFREEKKIFQLFPKTKSVIDIKAKVENSIIIPGDKVKLSYEVHNNSNLNIAGVETKLIEVYHLITKGHSEVKLYYEIKDSDTKTAAIQRGETQNMDIEVSVPSELGSIENSKFLSREYLVSINVAIPFPHRNAVLKIPIQVGKIIDGNIGDFREPPPSYWEVMKEEKEGEKSQSEDEFEEDEENLAT